MRNDGAAGALQVQGKTIAAYTLGCKVNQYDTEAMLERFEAAGYRAVEFQEAADVYLINTCTVTGTGDRKSLKTIRRVAREHPGCAIVVCGCLAQREAERLAAMDNVALVPVRMARCVVRLDGKDGEKRRERLEKIAREAAKQCGRGMPLQVNAPMDWRIALRAMAGHDLLLIPWEEAGGTRLKDVFASRGDARDIGIVVGPEGGITPEEVEDMVAAGGRCVTLGPRILRTETAAVVSAALVMQLWGDI